MFLKRLFCCLMYTSTCFIGWNQANTLPLHTFYKDQLLQTNRSQVFQGSSFFPTSEREYDLHKIIRDSSDQYYEFTEYVLKKHLLEIKHADGNLTVSPLINLTYGKDRRDTIQRRLYQNMRGVLVEGDLLKNFSFTTQIYETQARFSNYETAYYAGCGELYPNTGGQLYLTQNAVIPGAARTKPFKGTAFDYAYAVGNLVFAPSNRFTLIAGNTPVFIGDGYRSLMLSDNGIPSPFIKSTFQLHPRWTLNTMRMRLTNFIRKPKSSTVEAYYEMKGYSANYLSFKATEKLSISLYEGGIWFKDDSLLSVRMPVGFYNPIPLGSNIMLKDRNRVNCLNGLNFSYIKNQHHRFYGQLVVQNFDSKKIASQLGWRGYNLFGLTQFLLQLEVNSVPAEMYRASNSRLSFSSGNLPLTHIKGNGFQEYLLRCNYEWKRLYADIKVVAYVLTDYNSFALLPINKFNPTTSGFIYNHQLELGYRINRKINLNLFANWVMRTENTTNLTNASILNVGVRTGITNHYTDF